MHNIGRKYTSWKNKLAEAQNINYDNNVSRLNSLKDSHLERNDFNVLLFFSKHYDDVIVKQESFVPVLTFRTII